MLFDHLLTLVLVVVFPAYVARDVPRLAQRIAADPLNARTKDYLWGIAIQWGSTLALIGAWWWTSRPVREIGLRLPETASAWWWSLLIGGAGTALFAKQGFSVLRSTDAQAQVRKRIESQPGVRTVLPSTPREAHVFIAVAVTAGICEEVLYRGYLLWYLQSFMPRGVAIVAAILAFGVGHAYQGLRGIFATSLAGATAMAVYLLTGSLLASVVLHTALDLVNGFTIYRAFRAESPSV